MVRNLTKEEIGQKTNEACRGSEHDDVRAHIEFAYTHYAMFIKFCKDKIEEKE